MVELASHPVAHHGLETYVYPQYDTENGLALLRLPRLLMLSAVNFLPGISVLAYACLVVKAHTTSRRFHAKQGVTSESHIIAIKYSLLLYVSSCYPRTPR